MYTYIIKKINEEELNKEIKLLMFYRSLNDDKKAKLTSLIESLSHVLNTPSDTEKE